MNTDKLGLMAFEGKTVLVTGATGLIGSSFIFRLLDWNKTFASVPIHIIALVRNKEKAEKMFEKYELSNLEFWIADVCNLQIERKDIDYIVHSASQTSSKMFVEQPVETIMTAIKGTQNMLELARINALSGFIYLSSMEVYGSPSTDEKITEDHATNLNTMEVRSCYPESKRMCEQLCTAYYKEYNIPIKVLRLTQTFGQGVQYNDGRVFAEFARCVIEKRNIVLNTKGDTKRSYLAVEDAVNAILMVLIYGCDGEAYNVANEDTYCSIYEMATMVAEKCADGEIKVVVNEKTDISAFGYAPTLMMNLDTSKLRKLGWNATMNLEEIYTVMIEDMKRNK